MKKLIQGIIDFRQNIRDEYKEAFGRLAVGQSPDTLFIACSDSRVVPNTFASTNPGDLFVLRNVGNLIPPCSCETPHSSQMSESAAIEYAVNFLKIKDIVVCGHSECAAMRALVNDRQQLESDSLKDWLKYGDQALVRLNDGVSLDQSLSKTNQLSQLNVLQQIEHLKTYPSIQKRLQEKTLSLHGWWFDITHADVYAYQALENKFVLIDESFFSDLSSSSLHAPLHSSENQKLL